MDDAQNKENIELYLQLMDRYKMTRLDPDKYELADEYFMAAREIYQFLELTDEEREDLMNAVS